AQVTFHARDGHPAAAFQQLLVQGQRARVRIGGRGRPLPSQPRQLGLERLPFLAEGGERRLALALLFLEGRVRRLQLARQPVALFHQDEQALFDGIFFSFGRRDFVEERGVFVVGL